MFLNRNKKNNTYPCKPQFYHIKEGLRGSKLYRYVFVTILHEQIQSGRICYFLLLMCSVFSKRSILRNILLNKSNLIAYAQRKLNSAVAPAQSDQGQVFVIRTKKLCILGYPQWGDSNKYPKHNVMWRNNKTRPILHVILSIKTSLQQQIHFNGNIFGNK